METHFIIGNLKKLSFRPISVFQNKIWRLSIALLLGTLMYTGCGVAAAGANSTIDECNQLYHDSSWEEAIACYENLETSAASLFNIGNTYAKIGKTGYAILYYLRAQFLTPDDSDIISNLAHLREAHSLYPPEPSLTEQFFNLLSLSQWSILCLLALVSYLLFILIHLRKRQGKVIEIAVIVICIAGFSVGTAGATIRYKQWQQSVVVADGRLLVSPFASAESTGSIVQGRLVTPLKTYKDYVYIKDEMGRKGWLRNELQIPILADSQ